MMSSVSIVELESRAFGQKSQQHSPQGDQPGELLWEDCALARF